MSIVAATDDMLVSANAVSVYHGISFSDSNTTAATAYPIVYTDDQTTHYDISYELASPSEGLLVPQH